MKDLKKLEQTLDKLYQKQDVLNEKTDYQRLFDKGEYEAAVIMAFRHLESTINLRKGNLQGEPMIYQLRGESAVAQDKLSQMKRYRQIRNRVVHANTIIEKNEAEDVIKYIEEICHLIENGEIGI